MSPGQYMRSAFSPHGIAVLGLVTGNMLALVGVLAIAVGHAAAGVIICLTALILRVAMDDFSLCPACGKSPFKVFHADDESGLVRFFHHHRAWPERECSGCRRPLDIL